MKSLLCLIPLLVLSTGCAAAGPSLRQQVSDLEATNVRQAQQLKELETKYALAKAETVKGDLTQAGKDAMESVKAIWQAEGVSESYDRIQKSAYQCYQHTDLSQLKTWEEYKAMVLNCWHDAASSK